MDIICVDREELTLGILAARFKYIGWQARFARSADEAMAMVRDRIPDVLVTEVRLQASNGYRLVRSIRHDDDPLINTLPILILTHMGQTQDILYGLDLEVTGYMTKPFDIVRLEEDLRELAGSA
jgi:two-component system phosphate regulon response regulator PhoB